jgi:phosphoribosylaminoimidazole-succinocarboxamide synthase
MSVVLETQYGYLFSKGKVRDTYDLGDRLLMVTTDRLSAFDVVLPTGIPGKGAVLNQLSAFWFGKLGHIVPNHLLEVVLDIKQLEPYRERLGAGADLKPLVARSMIVRKAEPILIECVVRGYLSGSGWAEYRKSGTIGGMPLPPGLVESSELRDPMFTPSTKAASGHDENISVEQMAAIVGRELTHTLERLTVALYSEARAYARERGIIIADTKFEFGMIDGQVILIDEALTPDSSRFWDAASYQPGGAQPSFDKHYVRDWLTDSGWNKEPPAPELPSDVVAHTAGKYREAYRRITGADVQGV